MGDPKASERDFREPRGLPPGRGIALIGYRGTGKSTVGRIVAEILGGSFVDADAALETRLGRSIRSIFEAEGEASFRDREESILAELTAEPAGKVLATGGGAVLREANRKALKAFGRIVWLRADPGVLADRLASHDDRPALTSAGTLAEIAAVLAAREPIYRALADAVVETDGRTPAQVARGVIAALGELPGGGRGAPC